MLTQKLIPADQGTAEFCTSTFLPKCVPTWNQMHWNLLQLPPKHGMATTHVRSSEVQTPNDICTRSTRSRRSTQLALRKRSARSRHPTQLPTTSAAFTGCRSKKGIGATKLFLCILANDATNYIVQRTQRNLRRNVYERTSTQQTKTWQRATNTGAKRQRETKQR